VTTIQTSADASFYTRKQSIQVLAGTMLLSMILGSIHAFSILLPAMEKSFGVSRTEASLTYSFGLIALSLAVLFGHRLYDRVSPPVFVVATGLLAAAGCFLAGVGGSLAFAWFGYSLLFGAANGLGYGYALQFSGRALPAHNGFAMGAVTAAYAVGAVVAPVPLELALQSGGWVAALELLAVCIIVVAAISALFLAWSGATYGHDRDEGATPLIQVKTKTVTILWIAYACSVTAGLMAIGHATGIARTSGVGVWWVVVAPIIIALFNMMGSILCGVLLDRIPGRPILCSLAIASSGMLFAMAVYGGMGVTMAGLAVVGFIYGGTISVYPAFISKCFGVAGGTIVYGRVFTAWAVAGLVGPASAGILFDLYADYRIALTVAGALGLGALIVVKMPTGETGQVPEKR
jgi:MFS family permease